MKFSHIILLIGISLSTPCTLIAQDRLFYVSILGNWDKQKLKDRAQFAGDNRIINTYFNNFKKELLRSGRNTKGTGEISFAVRADGVVDSLVIVKRVGYMYDSTILKVLQSMSGKWRAGLVYGTKKQETLTIWYSIYEGPKLKKTMEEFVSESKKSFESGDFKKALRLADNAMDYDALSVEATVIKIKALSGLNQRTQACELIKEATKYENERFKEVLTEVCN